MASPGQRVATVQPALGLAPSIPTSTEQVTGGGISRLNQAYKEGFLTTEDVINGLSIRAKQRKTQMLEEGKKQKDLEENEQLRGLNFRAKKAKSRGDVALGELDADIAESYAGTTRVRGGVERLGETAAGDRLVQTEAESLKLDQTLREAHKLKEDPIGLTRFYITKAAEWGEEVDPNASLGVARAKFQAGYQRQKESAMQLEILKAKLDAAVRRGEKVPDLEQGLRKEFDGQEEVKTYNKVVPFLSAIQDVVKKEVGGVKASGADDLKLIFSYMKLLDPGSVVRETEFANAQNAAGIPDVVRNVWNRALNGTRLNPAQRKEFLDSAQAAIRNYQIGYDRQKMRFKDVAEAGNLDPKNVVIDPTVTELPPKVTPSTPNPVINPPATNTSLEPGVVIVTLRDGSKIRARRTPAGFLPLP